MRKEIRVPQIGESITSVTIGAIFRKTGDRVLIDEELLEIETDKLNQPIYATENGICTITVSTGQEVPVGTVIGYIEKELMPTQEPQKDEEVIIQKEPPVQEKMVKALDIDEEITHIEKPLETRKRLSQVRRVISKKLLELNATTAMLTTFNEVDMSEVLRVRERYGEEFLKKYGIRLGLMSFFVRAACYALEKYPIVNSFIDKEELVTRASIDIAIAVATDDGVFVPVLHKVSTLSFQAIEEKIKDFADRAKKGNLSIGELQGAGFTITNAGTFGSMLSTPMLNPGQSAILGMHKIQERPVVRDGSIVVRSMMYLALTYDHCILDGKDAVQFLGCIKSALEDPERMRLGIA